MADQVRLEFVVIDKTGAAISKAKGQINGLNKSLGKTNGIAKKVAGALAAIGTGILVRGLINTIRQFEDLRATLVTVEGSTQAAAKSFRLIKDFTQSTPFQLQDVTSAFITFRNAGLNPTIDFMTSVGNIAAGMGRRIDDVARAVFNATTGEFEMLKQLGIKVKTEGDKLKVIFKGTTTEITNNGIDIIEVIEKIGKTDFAGGIERQAQTLTGAFSNLQDEIAIFADEVGEGGLTAALTEITRGIIDASEGSENFANALGKNVGATLLFVRDNLDIIKIAFGVFIGAKVLGGAIVGVGRLAVGLKALTPAFLALRAAVIRTTVAMMANPITAIGVGLALAGAVIFRKQLMELVGGFDEVTKATKENTIAMGAVHAGMEATAGATKNLSRADRALLAIKEQLQAQTTKYIDGLDKEIVKLEAAKQPTEALRRLYEAEHGVLKGINAETRERILLKLKEIESEKQLAAAKKALPGIAKDVGGVLAERFPEVEAEQEKLKQLKRLKDEGILSEREYSIAVKKIQDNRARDAIAARKKEVDDVIDLIKTGQAKTNDIEALSGEQRVQLAKSIGLELVNVLGQYSEKAFKIAKAAAIAEAIVSTAQGIANALKVLPFPLNLAAAALVAAKGYAQVQQIRSTSYTGPREKGGDVRRDQSYLVGESGPEIFRPGTAGTIIPNNQMGNAMTVNFNIETVDATGFDELLVERRSTIVGIINQAFNRQGRQGVTT
tara:strand:+ start:20597 stop:22771 length:2175 start_codon:yes stop_codon:yes gene_type:complete